MSLSELVGMPAHLLAASLNHDGKRLPIRLVDIGPGRLVVDSAQLACGERTRILIACPLSDRPFEVAVEAVRVSGARSWLQIVS